MADIGTQVCRRALTLVSGKSGVHEMIGELAMAANIQWPSTERLNVKAENIAAELMEKSAGTSYPSVHLYCERVTNAQREKFRRFSGTVRMVAEARTSQDRLEGIEERSRLLAEAVTEVLDRNRGDWGQGMLYSGGYEISFGPVKHGGKNFIQITKISFEVDVSN